MPSFLDSMPKKRTFAFVFVMTILALVMWVATASMGVGSVNQISDDVTKRKLGDADDINGLLSATGGGQVGLLVTSLLMAVGFGVGTYFLWKADVANDTNRTLLMSFIVAIVSLVMWMATSSAAINGMGMTSTELSVGSDKKDPNAQPVLDALDSASGTQIGMLILSLCGIIAFSGGTIAIWYMAKKAAETGAAAAEE
jgi:hypothetical protein